MSEEPRSGNGPLFSTRLLCGAWGDRNDPRLPADWPMPPACNLTAGHDGPHRGSFGIEWNDE